MKPLAILILAAVALTNSWVAGASPIKDDETVIFFPTSAFLDSEGQAWIFPVHGWIFEMEEDSLWRNIAVDRLLGLLEVEPEGANRAIYEERGRMFLVDNERVKEIEIRLGGSHFDMDPSEPNGHFRGKVQVKWSEISDRKEGDWIMFQAIMPEKDDRLFQGKVHLIEPQGISVISDIDDTIKVSNVKDKKALLANTFLKPFRAVPGMPDLYRKWEKEGAVFHYVSASPWQLYPTLSEFIGASGFPPGSFHLKNFRVKDRTFYNLFSSQEAYKKPLIEKILQTYPNRRFVLVGDGGEEDPEIFAAIARSHGDQVAHIFIRNAEASGADDERYRMAFDGIAESRWTLFQEGGDLRGFRFGD